MKINLKYLWGLHQQRRIKMGKFIDFLFKVVEYAFVAWYCVAIFTDRWNPFLHPWE